MALKTSLIVDLAGNMQARARQYGQALSTMGQKGQTAMRGLKSAAVAAGQGLDKLGNRYTAMITGAGAGLAVKGVMQTEQLFARLRITMGATSEEVEQVKRNLEDVANMRDIRQPMNELALGYKAIIDATGDKSFADNNSRNLGLLMSATGADAQSAGDLLVQFRKMGVTSAEDVAKAIAILSEQAKAGAFPLEQLATSGAKVFSLLAAQGRTGLEGVREVGATLQVAYQTTSNAETAVTAVESFMADVVQNAAKLKKLANINVFEVIDGKKVTRAPDALIKEILTKSRGDIEKISMVLGDVGRKALLAPMGEFNKTGKTGEFDSFKNVTGDLKTLTDDAKIAADTTTAALQGLKNAWDGFADKRLSGPIKDITTLINTLSNSELDKGLEVASKAAVALGGVLLTYKAVNGGINMTRSVRGWFGGGKDTGASGGMGAMNGLAGLKSPLPVFVVNKQMSLTKDAMLGKDGGISPTSGTAASPAKGKAGPQQKATSGVQAGVVIATALNAGRVLMDDEATLAEKAEGVAKVSGEAMGGWAGAALGAKAGAVLGSFIPGFGTAIGAALGAAVGGIGGSMAGGMGMDAAMSWVKGLWAKDKPEAQMQPLRDDLLSMQENYKKAIFDSVLRVQVDGPATATLQSNNSMGGIDVYSGTSFSKGF